MDLLRYRMTDGKIVIVTDCDIRRFIDNSQKTELANFIHDRHFYRYIMPFIYKSRKKIKTDEGEFDEYSLLYKNGFSMMAICCLLIETLEAFYRGWPDTKYKSEKAFLKFFTRDRSFIDFSTDDIPSIFYKNIRCGILHQGETTGGWTLTRKSDWPLLNKTKKIINVTKFMKTLSKSLKDYRDELLTADWNDPIWTHARSKLKAILKNCK